MEYYFTCLVHCLSSARSVLHYIGFPSIFLVFLMVPYMLGNRPFPSSHGPLCQNEVKCSAFDKEMIYDSHANKLIFTRKVVHLASF